MNTIQKFVAKNAILKCMISKEIKHKDVDLISQINQFETLEDFFEYFIVSRGAPLNCLPYSFTQNEKFLLNLFNKKNSLINEIYDINNNVYHEILDKFDLNKFLKRCKFHLRPEIKKEIAVLRSNQPQQDEIVQVILPNGSIQTKKD